jgi:hypothetical protein
VEELVGGPAGAGEVEEGTQRKKCTTPVTVIPTRAAVRPTRHHGRSASGSRASTVEVTATRRLLWIVK